MSDDAGHRGAWRQPQATTPESDQRLCVACGESVANHLGPPSPPLTRGHLGATEDRPGSCLTTRGEIDHPAPTVERVVRILVAHGLLDAADHAQARRLVLDALASGRQL